MFFVSITLAVLIFVCALVVAAGRRHAAALCGFAAALAAMADAFTDTGHRNIACAVVLLVFSAVFLVAAIAVAVVHPRPRHMPKADV